MGWKMMWEMSWIQSSRIECCIGGLGFLVDLYGGIGVGKELFLGDTGFWGYLFLGGRFYGAALHSVRGDPAAPIPAGEIDT